MSLRHSIAVLLGAIVGAWLTFDGARAFIVGDYVTPRSGVYAGQLGPWSGVVSAIGLEPRSNVVKAAHVLIGISWLVAVGGLAARARWGRSAVLGCAAMTLWYLPFGTLISIAEIALLALSPLRESRRSA